MLGMRMTNFCVVSLYDIIIYCRPYRALAAKLVFNRALMSSGVFFFSTHNCVRTKDLFFIERYRTNAVVKQHRGPYLDFVLFCVCFLLFCSELLLFCRYCHYCRWWWWWWLGFWVDVFFFFQGCSLSHLSSNLRLGATVSRIEHLYITQQSIGKNVFHI